MNSLQRWGLPAAFAILLTLVGWAYWPGLAGPFMFDDFGNLDVIGAYGPLHDLPSVLFYLSSGQADPIGRPLALATFLMDARTWPAPPWSFKLTNLLLHLLNAALLWRILLAIQARLARSRPGLVLSPGAPAFATMLWAAHPLFVSTTLYVVQREAMLPATFVLLALAAWIRAIDAFEAGTPARGWAWAIVGVGGATLLATLCKANGLLAPLLIGIVHACCLRSPEPRHANKATARAAWICLALPSALLVGYLVFNGWQLWSQPLMGREWTLPQRLLSEPRAFWTYVARLLLPRFGGGGVYVEGFAASRDWWMPATTLPAFLALLVSVMAAIAMRRRWPLLACAWLFFIGGHLLEGSSIPLELYFEHRNYLPSMLLAWPLADWLLRAGGYARYRRAFALLLFAALLVLTRQRASVWGDERLLAVLAAEHQPNSLRAQTAAATVEINSGRVAQGLAILEAAQSTDPRSIDVAITRIAAECSALHRLDPATLYAARKALAGAQLWNYGLYVWLQDAARLPALRDCRGFGLDGLDSLVAAAESNPQNRGPQRLRDLWHTKGRIALARGNPEQALQWFDGALRLRPDADYALVQAAALGSAGVPGLGARHLDTFRLLSSSQRHEPIHDMMSLHRWLLQYYGYYDDEVSSLRERLCHDARDTTEPCQ